MTMVIRLQHLVFGTLAVLAFCNPGMAYDEEAEVKYEPIDKDATPEARALFHRLRQIARTKMLFGHQDSTAYGVGWSAEEEP